MALTERLAILIDANGAAAVNEFNKVGAAASKNLASAESASARLGANLTRIGATATVAGGALTLGLTKAAGKASDLEQATGAAEAVFGVASKTIERFGETSADSLGLSEAAFKQLTATVGALLQGFGFTQQEAANTSVKIAELGADLSAAFGGTTQQAIEAIGAALRGETDPIERYGAAFNQAAVDAKIAALGLDTSTAAAKANAKAQASLAIIYERTANVQGQFAREADTLAGKQQRSAAAAENASAALGEGFAPVLEKTSELTTKAANAFASFDDATNGVASSVAAIGVVALDIVGPLTTVIGTLLQVQATRAASAAASAAAAAATTAEAAAMGGVATAGAAATTSVTTLSVANQQLAVTAGAAAGGMTALQLAAFGAFGGLIALAGSMDQVDTSIDVSADTIAKILDPTSDAVNQIVEIDTKLKQTGETFNAILAQSPEAAARYAAAVKAAGGETAEFERQLAALGISLGVATPKEQEAFYQGLAQAYRNAGLAGATAADGARTAGVGLAYLKSQIDSIGKSFAPQFQKLDLDRQFAAVTSATKQAGGATRDYAAEQRALEQSTKRLTEAQQNLADAELALFLARQGPSERDKTDAELNKASAALDFRDAQNAVTDAQRAYNEALKDGDKEDIADARRALERANINLKRSELANADAQKEYNDVLASGAEGSKQVKDAQERLTEAQDGLADAQYNLTSQTRGATGAITDQGSAAVIVAGQFEPYIQSLIDSGASTSDIVTATEDAIKKVDELKRKYGELNPELDIYYQNLQEILAAELLLKLNQGGKLTDAERQKVLDSGVIVPDTSFLGPQAVSAVGSGATGVLSIPVVIDGKNVAEAMVDYSWTAGGLNIAVRN